MSVDRRIAAFLQLAGEELAAARSLAGSLPRQAAYFAQQSIEKIARAVLAREGIPFGPSHNIGHLADALPGDHPWRPRLKPFDRLSPAATSYRYPTSSGRLESPPSAQELAADLDRIGVLLDDARRELGGRER